MKEVSLESLEQYRAIVEWCTIVAPTLGSDTANYKNIDHSGAEDAASHLNLAGGALGFQQFGLAQLDLQLGAKDGKFHFQRSGPYKRIISAAEKAPVVLHDTAETQAWLVPATSVMLHIAQHRHRLEPFEVDSDKVNLVQPEFVDLSTKNILSGGASQTLSNNDQYTFKNLTVNIWSILEFLIDILRERNPPGTPTAGTFRDELLGLEFKAVVEEPSPFRQKQAMIGKMCGGWPMLARGIDALVLFANCFEDVIRSSEAGDSELCRLWKIMLKEKDYLATSVSALEDLYDVAGCRLDRKYLTSSRLQWDRGKFLVFEPFKSPGTHQRTCIRLQQIIPKSGIGHITSLGQLPHEGAVIFGRSGSPLRSIVNKMKYSLEKVKGLYSQPNISLTPIVVAANLDDDFSSSGRIR
ncbi:hypothetical protein CC78DRAFT_614295 [Lojkania enalia]|uniref:Uncharacterized protein n=1 Tax=Lojkania enalia TaxID=147567 RepID=A0A9P4N7U3_9PLEO|nr:hypothetical protein CC78DRAFT_614295 [Didymosphaeria enalia]